MSAIFFSFLIIGGYLMVTRLPWVGVYRQCFQTAYTTLNQEHLITRRAWTTDETICQENKKTLLDALICFQTAQTKQPLTQLEKDLIYPLSQSAAKGTKTMDQMIVDHNERCPYRKTVIDYDPRTNSWF